jgi:hypothetical protein
MLAFLAPFFQLLSGLMGYFRDKKLTDGAVAEYKVQGLEAQLHDIQKANRARDAVRAAAAADPSVLRAADPDSRD